MKTVTTSKGEFLFVEIPEDAYAFSLYHIFGRYLEDNSPRFLYFIEWREKSAPLSIMTKQELGYEEYEIVTTTEEITKEQAASIVEDFTTLEKGSYYKDYRDKHAVPFLIDPINSFITLLHFLNLRTARYLVLKKKVKVMENNGITTLKRVYLERFISCVFLSIPKVFL